MADVDTKQLDFGRISMLLGVVQQVAGVGPQFQSLSNAAMTELHKINDAILEASKKGQEVPAQAPLTDADPTEPRPDEDLQHKLELPHEHRERRDYKPFEGDPQGRRV